MPFKSPLSNLSEILVQIQESAKLYGETLRTNEAATRAVLIDPVLRALGWDTANTNMVEVESTMASVRADYALYDKNTIPSIIVEAKPLGTDLEQWNLKMMLVNYAYNFGVKDVFLTDGLAWQHFNEFQPESLAPTKVLNLGTDDVVACAAYFVQHFDAAKYWPVEQSIDVLSQRVDELENLVSNLQKKLLEVSSSTPSLVATQEQNLPLTLEPFIPLEELADIAGKRPTRFRLPDGQLLDVYTWKDILRESCKFTLANNVTIYLPFPDRIGRRISLFSLEKPANDVSFVTEQYNGQQIYIYLNYDSNNCVKNARYILDQAPKELMKMPPAIVLKD